MTALADDLFSPQATAQDGSVQGFVEQVAGECRLNLLVDGAHCAACIQAVEMALTGEPGLVDARLNLTLRRLSLRWRGDPALGDRLAAKVKE